jgi:hypothetical protein
MNLSLAGCSSAEPASVSIHHYKIQLKRLYLQLVKKDSHLPSKEMKDRCLKKYGCSLKVCLSNNKLRRIVGLGKGIEFG